MLKSVILAVFVGLAIPVRASTYKIRIVLGPDVSMPGFNSEPIIGPAMFESGVEATFPKMYFHPTIFANNVRVTYDCIISQEANVPMVDDRSIVIQAVTPLTPVVKNGAVLLNCVVQPTT